jgi:hypothetical protein
MSIISMIGSPPVKPKVLVGFLLLLLLVETGYIVAAHHPIARFKPVDVDSYLAFDSATGQLCKTFRTTSTSRAVNSAPASTTSPRSSSSDAILNMIQGGNADAHSADAWKVQFLRNLPVCADIR